LRQPNAEMLDVSWYPKRKTRFQAFSARQIHVPPNPLEHLEATPAGSSGWSYFRGRPGFLRRPEFFVRLFLLSA
ncbi:MAG: hypothetical protein ONB44_21075, partial [candidate division KSB1 bacterium]|nr:hypothetical protein [candidate division KSB1 bacterium]